MKKLHMLMCIALSISTISNKLQAKIYRYSQSDCAKYNHAWVDGACQDAVALSSTTTTLQSEQQTSIPVSSTNSVNSVNSATTDANNFIMNNEAEINMDLGITTNLSDALSSDNSLFTLPDTFNMNLPQTFEPQAPFNAPGLIGDYLSNNNTAIVYDPFGINKQIYNFQNVQPDSGTISTKGLSLIGTMKVGQITTKLYGTLQGTTSSQDTVPIPELNPAENSEEIPLAEIHHATSVQHEGGQAAHGAI